MARDVAGKRDPGLDVFVLQIVQHVQEVSVLQRDGQPVGGQAVVGQQQAGHARQVGLVALDQGPPVGQDFLHALHLHQAKGGEMRHISEPFML